MITADAGVGGAMSALLGDGTGRLGPETRFEGGALDQAVSVTPADFNGDGHLDVAMHVREFVLFGDAPDALRIRLGDGVGVLGAPKSFELNDPTALATGDFDAGGSTSCPAIALRPRTAPE